MSYEESLRGALSQPDDLTGMMSEPEGLTGMFSEAMIRGYSAYEVAVKNGFEGTEAEWLASLKGDPGPKGDPGEEPITLSLQTQVIPIRLDEEGKTAAPVDVYVDYEMKRGNTRIWGSANSSQVIRNITYTRVRLCTPEQVGMMRFQIPQGVVPASWLEMYFWWNDETSDEEYIHRTVFFHGIRDGAKGDAYVLTAEDKAEIYDLLLAEYPAVEEVSF